MGQVSRDREAIMITSMKETDPVASNVRRAYRDAASQTLPPQMRDLLRKLREQDAAAKEE